jgi:N-acetylglucosamine-6-phosphate deacetylase
MLEAVRFMRDQVQLSPPEIALAAALNPARVLGLRDRGKIAPRARADLLVTSPALNLKAVFIGGREAG